MTWEQLIDLSNLILVPAMLYLVKLEKRIVGLQEKLTAVIAILAKETGIDLGEILK